MLHWVPVTKPDFAMEIYIPNSLKVNCWGFFFQHSKWESTIRVVRVKLNNGERVVGVRYPVALIKFVERMMKEKSDAEQLILQAVSIYTYKVYLCCGYFTGSKYLHIQGFFVLLILQALIIYTKGVWLCGACSGH